MYTFSPIFISEFQNSSTKPNRFCVFKNSYQLTSKFRHFSHFAISVMEAILTCPLFESGSVLSKAHTYYEMAEKQTEFTLSVCVCVFVCVFVCVS